MSLCAAQGKLGFFVSIANMPLDCASGENEKEREPHTSSVRVGTHDVMYSQPSPQLPISLTSPQNSAQPVCLPRHRFLASPPTAHPTSQSDTLSSLFTASSRRSSTFLRTHGPPLPTPVPVRFN
eukprot:scaffold6562_cov60-Phaeocystis_antarctica.AAC.8